MVGLILGVDASAWSEGLAVVALAWSNCHSGIDWLVSDFPDLDDTEWTGVFWGVAGGISTFFLAVRFGLHLLSEL